VDEANLHKHGTEMEFTTITIQSVYANRLVTLEYGLRFESGMEPIFASLRPQYQGLGLGRPKTDSLFKSAYCCSAIAASFPTFKASDYCVKKPVEFQILR